MVVAAGAWRIRFDVGHVLFVFALGAYCIWYLFDTRRASTNYQNLLLIEPAVIFAVLLLLVILKSIVSIERSERAAEVSPPAVATEEIASDEPAEDGPTVGMAVAAMALMAVYVAAIPYIGFDGASLLFIATAIFMQGERRPAVLVLVPIGFVVVVVYGFKQLLPIPIPTLFG